MDIQFLQPSAYHARQNDPSLFSLCYHKCPVDYSYQVELFLSHGNGFFVSVMDFGSVHLEVWFILEDW